MPTFISVKITASFQIQHLIQLYSSSNGNGTDDWSPIRSVIIQVITKSDDPTAGVRFIYHEQDYGPNWTTRSLVTIFQKRRIAKL